MTALVPVPRPPRFRETKQSFVDATGTAFLTAAGVLLLAAEYVVARAPKRGELHPSQETTSQSVSAKSETTSRRSAAR